MRHSRIEHQAVAIHNRSLHALVNTSRRSLPRKPSLLPVEFKPIGKLFSLLPRADQLDHSEKLLMSVVLLLLLEHKHEVVTKARLHHDPVDSAVERDVRGEEDDVLALQRGDALVLLHEVWHHLLERTLPLARGARTRATVRPQLARVLVLELLGVRHIGRTAIAQILARKQNRIGHLLHAQVADVAKWRATRRAARELRSAVRAHNMTALALKDRRQSVVEADRTLEQIHKVLVRVGGRRRRAAW